jgi:hypothetical protein
VSLGLRSVTLWDLGSALSGSEGINESVDGLTLQDRRSGPGLA